jgi:ABC-type oligopeptide transport system substrate-binding subunit
VARQLARIHLHVTVVSLPSDALYLKTSTPGAPFDITDGGWATDYVDPADYLVPIATRSGIKAAGATNIAYYVDKSTEASIAHAVTLVGAARDAAFADIEWNLRTKQVPYIATAISTRPTLFSSRVGCQVNNPAYGLDLGALCIRPR